MKFIDSFTVTGVTVRTQNSDEFNKETAKLPNLWQQFHSNNPVIKTAIFSVYSDYESDANGPYSVTVGVANDNQGTELHTVKVASGNYFVFHGKGSMPQAVIETWERVWDYFIEGSLHQRCFITDFEAYTNSDEVSIYIGVN
jgi:predicted transcriptional regulator YdeE